MKRPTGFQSLKSPVSNRLDRTFFIRLAIIAVIGLLVPALGTAAPITLLASGQASLTGVIVSGNTVYFASSIGGAAPSINTVGINGGAVNTLYTGLTSPNSLTIIGNTLFWIDANSGPVTDTQILAAPRAGGGPVNAIYTGANVGQPIVDGSGITNDGSSLYTADEVQGRVHTLHTDGTGLTQLGPNRYGGFFNTEHLNTIVAFNGFLYVLDAGRSGVITPQVVTIPVGGGSFTPLWVGAPFNIPTAITIGNNQIFIGDGNTIWTMPLIGGQPTVFFSGGPLVNIAPSGLFYNGSSLFVGDQGAGDIFRIDTVPEPSTVSFLILGLLGLAFGSKRVISRKRASGAEPMA